MLVSNALTAFLTSAATPATPILLYVVWCILWSIAHGIPVRHTSKMQQVVLHLDRRSAVRFEQLSRRPRRRLQIYMVEENVVGGMRLKTMEGVFARRCSMHDVNQNLRVPLKWMAGRSNSVALSSALMQTVLAYYIAHTIYRRTTYYNRCLFFVARTTPSRFALKSTAYGQSVYSERKTRYYCEFRNITHNCVEERTLLSYWR